MPPRPNRSTIRNVGQLAVDIALLLPVAVVLTCGLVEISRAVIIHQAMQNAVEHTTGTDRPSGGEAVVEQSVHSAIAESLGTGADRFEVHAEDAVVSVTLQGALLGPGPVHFLEGTTLVANSTPRQ